MVPVREEALLVLLKATGPSGPGTSPPMMPIPDSVGGGRPGCRGRCSSVCGERPLLARFSTTEKQKGESCPPLGDQRDLPMYGRVVVLGPLLSLKISVFLVSQSQRQPDLGTYWC